MDFRTILPRRCRPNNPDSYWSKHCAPMFRSSKGTVADKLVAAVNSLCTSWRAVFRLRGVQAIGTTRPYYMGGSGSLTASSGLLQIKDYIDEKDDEALLAAYRDVQGILKDAKTEFHRMLLAKDGLDYLGAGAAQRVAPMPVPPAPPPKPDIAKVVKQTARAKKAAR